MSALLKSPFLLALRWHPFRRANLAPAVIIFMALLVGAAMPIYVGLMGAQLSKLAALPALLLFAFLLVYDRKLTLLLIILFRASGDIFLQFTRFALGSYQIGVGGLINIFVIVIAILLMLEKPRTVPAKNTWPWALFLLIAFYGLLLAPAKADAIRSWSSLLSYLAVFVGAFHFVRTKDDFKFCVRLVLYSSLFPILYAFLDIALNHGQGGPEGFRLRSTFGHANEFAFYLTLVITLAFYWLKSAPPGRKPYVQFALGAYLLLLIGLLILTKTRSAWLACFLGFTLYALFFDRRYLLYLGAMVVAAGFMPGVADRLADLGRGNEVVTYGRLNSFAWRVYLWESALRWTRPAYYLLGNGLQSFKEYSQIFFPMAGRTSWGAHSVYVQLLFELGAVGFAAYLFLYYRVLRELKAMLRFDRLGAFFLIIVVLNYLICAASDNMLDYLSYNWYLWFIIGAGCALVRVSEAAPPVQKAAVPRSL